MSLKSGAGRSLSTGPVVACAVVMLKLLLCLCFFFCSELNQPQVATKYGSLRGKWMRSRSGKSFVAFEGIPFAKPPVGQRRFKLAESPDRWEGLRDATEPGQECLQYDYLFSSGDRIIGSEDCLYLSVHTPDVIFSNLLPVVVYFHGVTFELGRGQTNHGPEYLMDEKIVIVSANYRLGPLGFLSFEDEELPGNMGLRDQQLALTWVRENIAAFGGHPKKVTIMGESAGGASVNFHIISPLSKGLFQKAISMSGNSYTPWALVKTGLARERAMKTAEDVGCLYNGTKNTLDCLRAKNATDILNLRSEILDELSDPLVYYGPVVDSKAKKPFLPGEPKTLGHNPVPWLMGVSSGDGLLKTTIFTNNEPFDWPTLNANLNYFIRTSLLLDKPIAGNDMLAEEVRQFYFGDNPLFEESFVNMTNLFSDGWFWYPTVRAIENHKGPIYLYYFDYLGDFSFADIIGSRRIINASCHLDETLYLWNTTAIFPSLEGDDFILSRTLVKLWTNFIKNGSPTTNDSILNWKKSKNNNYMHIHNGGYSMETQLLEERTKFWKNISLKYNV